MTMIIMRAVVRLIRSIRTRMTSINESGKNKHYNNENNKQDDHNKRIGIVRASIIPIVMRTVRIMRAIGMMRIINVIRVT